MTNLPELIILDVGHGGCAVLRDTNHTIIIDCAPGSTLIELLEKLNVHEISNILISHADSDHIAGIITLLSNLEMRIHNIYLNPDSVKDTQIWTDLRFALRDARKRNRIKIHIGLTTEQTGQLDTERVKIEILAPSPELAMSGVGGKDLRRKPLNSNSMSVVISLIHESHRIAILPGDIDEIGLSNLTDDYEELHADLLIFPHHGGKPSHADSEQFARSLCSLVKPKVVLFSFDRNRFNNPREDIIKGIKTAIPMAYIVCTQLSKSCAAQLPNSELAHLSELPSKSRKSNCSCGGTLLIKINGNHTFNTSLFTHHHQFVKREVPTPMCLKIFFENKIS
ncbi:MAG TPA: MBL fold metallo-hydrolase [Methylomirabilota bacterium]|nr:MBL fold metallo-hydrolase [Methylomirabilota bacterium]